MMLKMCVVVVMMLFVDQVGAIPVSTERPDACKGVKASDKLKFWKTEDVDYPRQCFCEKHEHGFLEECLVEGCMHGMKVYPPGSRNDRKCKCVPIKLGPDDKFHLNTHEWNCDPTFEPLAGCVDEKGEPVQVDKELTLEGYVYAICRVGAEADPNDDYAYFFWENIDVDIKIETTSKMPQ